MFTWDQTKESRKLQDMRFSRCKLWKHGMMVSLVTDTNDKSNTRWRKVIIKKKHEESYKNQLETKSSKCNCGSYHLGHETNEC